MPPAPTRHTPAAVDFDALPGHLIRRLQQIAVGLFMEETAAFDLTPVQFAALASIARTPGMDQRTLARSIGFDTSTLAAVLDRLERRALMQRRPSPEDRRVRRLHLTAEGVALLSQVIPAVQQAQQRILAPLPAADRARFLRMLCTLVTANNGASRAPSQPD